MTDEKQPPESPSEREFREFLADVAGLMATKVPTQEERTADYSVDDDAPGYLVEVKSRNPSDRVIDPTPDVKLPPVVRSMRHDDAVGGYLADARAQMRTLDPDHAKLWFLWVSTESPFDSDAQAERVFSTLYGYRRAIEAAAPHRQVGCYYAGRAAFDRFEDIDAVMIYRPVGEQADLQFCVNESSPRLETVLACKLARRLREVGLVLNEPSKAQPPDHVAVPRGLLASEGESAVLRFVQTATGIPRLVFWGQEVQYVDSVAVTLPKKEGDGGEEP